jgi:hypothetical protein
MYDLSADWKRWTVVERILAVTLTALVVVGVPVAMLVGGVFG